MTSPETDSLVAPAPTVACLAVDLASLPDLREYLTAIIVVGDSIIGLDDGTEHRVDPATPGDD
jgi:hypothetical protein